MRTAIAGALLAAMLVATLPGCAIVGPEYHRPDTKLPGQFPGPANASYSEAAVVTEFWKLFDDPLLVQLVEEARAANHDLRRTLARLKEARALRGEAAWDLAPTLSGSVGLNKNKLSSDQAAPFGGIREQRTYDAGFDAFWELDFVGRIRRNLEASTADLQASEADWHNLEVIVTSEVARNYFELRGLQMRLAVAKQNADNQGSTLQVTQTRLDAGRGTELDVSRARAQLDNTLSTLPTLETGIARTTFRLEVLTGHQPGTGAGNLQEARPLPALPEITPVGTPSDWLRRRPDVAAAERQLAAATARIGVATADLFPQVTFTGQFGWSAIDFANLGTAASETYALGPRISWAALDYGHVRERIRASRARAEGALAAYEQSVLLALEETDGALIAFTNSRRRREALAAAAGASEKATELAQLRYDAGVSDFLTVLDAERTLLDAQDRLAQSETDSATALVALYKALGAGWSANDSPFSPAKK